MASTLLTPQTIPDAAQPVQGIPGSRATFFLRSTPRVFTLLAAGQSNQDFQIAAVQPVDVQQILLGSRVFKRLAALSSPVELSGLVRVRALGSPQANPQTLPTGLARSRALGASVVSTVTPPVEPPVIPPPVYVPVSSPRNLRYVRRRNKSRER